MPAMNLKRAVWCINQDIESQLYSMGFVLGTGGALVYLTPTGMAEQPYWSLFGRPVIPLEQCSSLGTRGRISWPSFQPISWVIKARCRALSPFKLDSSMMKTCSDLCTAWTGNRYGTALWPRLKERTRKALLWFWKIAKHFAA
jgi:hypothetical protein